MATYLAAVEHHPKAGLCLDTCHLFAAGHDLDRPRRGGGHAQRARHSRHPGRDRQPARPPVRLVHANDSLLGCGSKRDRHEAIGAGQIGTGPFRELLAALPDVPFVVETPAGRRARARHRYAEGTSIAALAGSRVATGRIRVEGWADGCGNGCGCFGVRCGPCGERGARRGRRGIRQPRRVAHDHRAERRHRAVRGHAEPGPGCRESPTWCGSPSRTSWSAGSTGGSAPSSGWPGCRSDRTR